MGGCGESSFFGAQAWIDGSEWLPAVKFCAQIDGNQTSFSTGQLSHKGPLGVFKGTDVSWIYYFNRWWLFTSLKSYALFPLPSMLAYLFLMGHHMPAILVALVWGEKNEGQFWKAELRSNVHNCFQMYSLFPPHCPCTFSQISHYFHSSASYTGLIYRGSWLWLQASDASNALWHVLSVAILCALHMFSSHFTKAGLFSISINSMIGL